MKSDRLIIPVYINEKTGDINLALEIEKDGYTGINVMIGNE